MTILSERTWRVVARGESWLDVVRSQLQASPYASIRRLECYVENGFLILQGTVPTFYLKQTAQELVRRIRPGQPIVNAVTVANARTLPDRQGDRLVLLRDA
jgi:osmotically-inducible protein OsmY